MTTIPRCENGEVQYLFKYTNNFYNKARRVSPTHETQSKQDVTITILEDSRAAGEITLLTLVAAREASLSVREALKVYVLLVTTPRFISKTLPHCMIVQAHLRLIIE
jgi:hypothetical protein